MNRFKPDFIEQDGVFSEATIAEGKFSVPDSCCKSEAAGCGAKIHPSKIYYTVHNPPQIMISFRGQFDNKGVREEYLKF